MTLVAFHVTPNRADIITDTTTYDDTAMRMYDSTKTHLLPHIDAAVMFTGKVRLHARFMEAVTGLRLDSVDHLSALAEVVLPKVKTNDGEPVDGTVFVVGPSPIRRRFVAYAHNSGDGFKQFDMCDQFFCKPVPMDPLPAIPRTARAWADLAQLVHRNWAIEKLPGGIRMPIGGDVIFTRLERDIASQVRVHRFPREGADFRRAMIGTLHRAGQLGPCPCGSGQPLIVCHLRRMGPEPCACESGKPFAECHRVDPYTDESRTYLREHAADFYDTQAALAAEWRRFAADVPPIAPPPVLVPPRPTSEAA